MKKRFFVEKENIHDGYFTLTDDEHNHLSKVMRMSEGDEVECFFDSSDIFRCIVDRIGKKDSDVKIMSSYPCDANPSIAISLFQALPKLDKLELITQKICEIGATILVPFSSKFCIAKENAGKIDRLSKISISACKQCGRSSLLKIEKVKKFDEILPMLSSFDLVLFANEKEHDVTLKQAISFKKVQNVAIVVGSEGGFSDDEIEKLSRISTSFTFGKRILRTETAAITAVGDVICLLGD